MVLSGDEDEQKLQLSALNLLLGEIWSKRKLLIPALISFNLFTPKVKCLEEDLHSDLSPKPNICLWLRSIST